MGYFGYGIDLAGHICYRKELHVPRVWFDAT
jgi:hypothetical protein